MQKAKEKCDTTRELLGRIRHLRNGILDFRNVDPSEDKDACRRIVRATADLSKNLRQLTARVSSSDSGPVRVSLGRSDGIAKFFAFSFVHHDLKPLADLEVPFLGAGVYAVYYHGRSQRAYRPISGTETPIYVGCAEPQDPQAETLEEQGDSLFRRLKEHRKSILRTDLDAHEFYFRAVPVQSGIQRSVEQFMIRLFQPIWNKETKVCYGIGKHGDSPSTRTNKRSPWDTKHPGRKWAKETAQDQKSVDEIDKQIEAHFQSHRPIRSRESLYELLALK